ncbi:rhomboid-like protein [uncultured Streptomyces sp.]|uniref:rhomboid-like protein n=1 Tax=uncultured Streptomyces sp. TaxID=174707 RepID=UPI00260688AB|nr:rhomboid-like protein [uncultured Streptomyces sp.]
MPRKRAAAALGALHRRITGAPGAHLWLAALFVTTVLPHALPASGGFLRPRSTGLQELAQHPVRALTAGALWTDGVPWLAYAALFTLVHATAEHWLGTPRWVCVAVLAQTVPVLLFERVLNWLVRHGHTPEASFNSLGIDAGYGLAGAAAVLTYRIPRIWRYPYVFAVLVFFGVLLAGGRSFVGPGHVVAALTGLACLPLTRTAGSLRKTEHPSAQ